MINQVSFNNFRKFEKFPPINMGEINVFVGRNNAGKSTVLKALQLIKGNINTLSNFSRGRNLISKTQTPMFVFDVDELAELHIDNFDRALYNNAKRKEISLSVTIDDCSFTIVLDGQNINQNNYYVAVPYTFIELKNKNFHLTFDFMTRALRFELKTNKDSAKVEMLQVKEKSLYSISFRKDEVEAELGSLQKKLHSGDANNLSTNEMVEIVSKRQLLETSLKYLQKQIVELEHEIHSLKEYVSGVSVVDIKSLPEYIDTTKVNIIEQIFNNLHHYAHIDLTIDKRTTEYKETNINQQIIRDVEDELLNVGDSFINTLSNFSLEYIHAHAASQKVIYLKEDKTDVLSKSLAQFCKAQIIPGEEEFTFIKRWMKRFDIGEDFRIRDVDSAGYMLKIYDQEINNEDEESLLQHMNLADKGTGSIQIMTLLFSLAVIMHKVNSGVCYHPTILIEEPEQNIHPMLQSLLADLFMEYRESISKSNNSQIIIETHSEYLIRRIQGIVADKNYIDKEDLATNPFHVFYFDSESKEIPCYKMQFELTGNFSNKFGKGFFDAASDLDMKIIRKEILSNNNILPI